MGINSQLLHQKNVFFFLAVLELDVKDSFRYNKEIEKMEKP